MCCAQLKRNLNIQNKNECFSNSTVANENDKEFRIIKNQNQRVCKIQVDGCLINDNNVNKCDFIFYICDTEKLLLVELKGTDVEHAVRQLTQTKRFFKQTLNNSDFNYDGIIVSSSVPRSAERRFRNIQERTYKEHKLMIKKGHRKYIFKIN